MLKRETTIGLNGQAINLIAYRDIAIGISRRFMRPSSVFPNNTRQDVRAEASEEDDEDGMNAEQWMGHIADLQAAHSSHVAGMIYGRGITEQPGTTAYRREMFRLSSTDWHRFLGFVSTDDGGAESALGLGHFSPWQKEAEISRTERRWQLTQAAMEPEMQRMLGSSELRLRGVQAPALEAIQHGQSPVVAVMPTGGGKSLLFMLPAWISPRGVTVVVVPLIALRGDMLQRCYHLGISCVEWESRRPADQASIVLVTPESAITEDFMTFLNRQRLCHRLDRIVIDECHVILNDQTNFRPAMAQLGKLIVAQAQMIYLTATLPPTVETQLFQRLRTTKNDVHLFRARTHRTNIVYRFWQPTVSNRYANSYDWVEISEVVGFIQDRIKRARLQAGRSVIYGPTTKTVEQLAQLLGCEAYHSRTLDRKGVLARFQANTTGVVVATSALGMGVDIPNIRSIIHIGLPRSLLDYAQESGRAGRDGHRSEAIIIQPYGFSRPKWDPIHEDPVKAQAEQERLDRYTGAGCRRVVLDEYLDGHLRQYCGDSDASEQLCDSCDKDWLANEEEVESEHEAEHEAELATELATERESERNTPEDIVHSSRTEQPMEDIQYGRVDAEVIELSTDSAASSQRSDSESIGFRSQVGSISPIYRRSIEPIPAHTARPRVSTPPASISHPIRPALISQPIQPAQRTQSGVPSHAITQFQRQDRERQAVRAIYQERHQEIATGLEFLQQQAQLWQGRCWFCTQRGLDDRHDLYQCGAQAQHGNRSAKNWWIRVRRQIRYATFSGCYGCGMPQSICTRYVSAGTQGHCIYRGLLLSGVAVMVYGEGSEVIKEAWAQRLAGVGVSIGNEEELVRYLGSRHDGETVKLVHEYIWIRKRWIEHGERT